MRTGLEAFQAMKTLMNGQTGFAGWCLRTCRQAWGLPGDENDAISEWNSIPKEHRHTDPMAAPVGAPHFWKIGKHGHVALQALVAGRVISTDAPEKDLVGIVTLDWFEVHWGAQYLGWATEFQNKNITKGLATESKKPTKKATPKNVK